MSAETYSLYDNFKSIFNDLVVLNEKNDCIGKKPPECVLNRK